VNERTHLDLFSGIGGFALAAKWNGFRTVAFCDNEPYAQAVLRKHWPDVPIHKDIREVRGELYAGITLLTGGFPCQPFSVAGKQRGKTDDRYLWPEMLRVIREAGPTWIVGENVAGIVNMALDQVHADLEAEGYEVESVIIPACAVDAPHKRDRVWIVAHAEGGKRGGLQDSSSTQGPQSGDQLLRDKSGLPRKLCSKYLANSNAERKLQQKRNFKKFGSRISDSSENVAHPEGIGVQGQRPCRIEKPQPHGCPSIPVRESEGSKQAQWLPEPNVDRVVDGLPNRVGRIRGLGNAIVPQVASEIIRCIVEVSK
jgi:DNA (cytosine-5)-methyltransferase 1